MELSDRIAGVASALAAAFIRQRLAEGKAIEVPSLGITLGGLTVASNQVPSVGRVVHYVYGDRHVPALITDPANGLTVHLTVFPVGEPPFTDLVGYDESGAGGTWHWPEYVPSKGETAF